jgi:hypothetical protein
MSEEEWFIDNEDDLDDFKRSKIMTADQLALDDENEDEYAPSPQGTSAAAAAAVGQLVPFEITPLSDSNAVRPEYAVVDNVSYYNLVSMWTLMYAQVTQGIVVPPVLTLGNASGGGGGSVKFDF